MLSIKALSFKKKEMNSNFPLNLSHADLSSEGQTISGSHCYWTWYPSFSQAPQTQPVQTELTFASP